MKYDKYILIVLSIFLISLVFISSASAADTNKTNVLSIDESVNIENNLLSIDNNVASNELDNNTLKVSNDEVLTAGNNWYVNASKTSSGDGKTEATAVKTLTEALNKASNGDTVMIASGEYTGNGNIKLTIDKNLNFIKYGNAEAIFNAAGNSQIWTVTATSINITGLTFKNGKSDKGGAIYFKGKLSNSKINAKFMNNTAEYSGGAVYFESAVNNCNFNNEFTDNSAGGSGGAIYFGNSVNDSIFTDKFINNNANSDFGGGAIYFGSAVTKSTFKSYFSNNQAKYSTGGAIYFGSTTTECNFNNEFINNYANYNAGAIFFYNAVSKCNFTDKFTSNSANYDGGAIFFYNSVNNCIFSNEFTNNAVTTNHGGYGSAIYFHNPVVNSIFKNSVFLNNMAYSDSVSLTENNGIVEIKFKGRDNLLNAIWSQNDLSFDNVTYWGENGIMNTGTKSITPSQWEAGQNITLIIDNMGMISKKTMQTDFNGTVTLDLSNSPGNYNITVYHPKDTYYTESNHASITFSVLPKTDVTIIAEDVTKYYGGSERFNLKVCDSKLNPIADKAVSITINSVTYTRTTDKDGSTSIPLGLNSGQYDVIIKVDNITEKYTATILSTVDGTDLVKMYRNATQYHATFVDKNGKYLADGTPIQFNINGIFYVRKVSGGKGQAALNINLPQSTYVITAINTVTTEMHTNKVTVLPIIADNKDITKYYKNGTQYSVKLLADNGKAVGAGEKVTFNVNGVFYTRQTNASGIATLTINLPPSNYIITADYKECRVSNTINVLPVLSASDVKMKYKDGTQFKANLVDGQGKPYAGQSIEFNINGVLYKRTTDNTGQAALNINLPKGEYIITSSFNGSNIANKITIS